MYFARTTLASPVGAVVLQSRVKAKLLLPTSDTMAPAKQYKKNFQDIIVNVDLLFLPLNCALQPVEEGDPSLFATFSGQKSAI